jgi:hypothetical protein
MDLKSSSESEANVDTSSNDSSPQSEENMYNCDLSDIDDNSPPHQDSPDIEEPDAPALDSSESPIKTLTEIGKSGGSKGLPSLEKTLMAKRGRGGKRGKLSKPKRYTKRGAGSKKKRPGVAKRGKGGRGRGRGRGRGGKKSCAGKRGGIKISAKSARGLAAGFKQLYSKCTKYLKEASK